MGGFLCCFFLPGLWACVSLAVWWWFGVVLVVACSYIYRGGAARFFLRLVVALGLVSLYSLVGRCPFW